MDRIALARLLALSTAGFGAAFYALGAAIKPGFSSAAQFISELNATGTPYASQLGIFGFLPLGLLFAAFLLVARPHADVRGPSRLGWWLLWAQPLSLVGVTLAPCDAGCPTEGSATQAIHNLQGVLAYFATGLALVLLSLAPALRGLGVRAWLFLAGAWFSAAFVLMLVPDLAPVRGAVQRSADFALGLSLLVIAWRIVVAAAPGAGTEHRPVGGR